ncbi:ATP-binding cassette domain-containing protein [bacterium]|nr:ATP-binding cassette domain-containing protein [bacterium]
MSRRGAIILEDVRKEYRIVQKAAPRLGSLILSKAFEYFRHQPFEALAGVTLRIDAGEMVGFLGHNGAGKSTLLKVIAGITEPSAGRVHVDGRVTSLLELGVGFHPDLTGMENIFYNGAIMGMSKRQILDRLESIIAFSGIADFLYEPVRHYSSGMYSRLACSVALHLEPEIILVDEILSVGDAGFQQRALQKVRELHASGVTVLLVSHDAATMAAVCSRVIWLDHGRVREDGPSAQVMEHYSKHMIESSEKDGPFTREFVRSAKAIIQSVRLDPSEAFRTGDDASVVVSLHHVEVPVRAVVRWSRLTGEVLFEATSDPWRPRDGDAGTLVYQIQNLPLCPVDGTVSVAVIAAEDGRLLDQMIDVAPLRVISDSAYYHFATRCDAEWTCAPLAT